MIYHIANQELEAKFGLIQGECNALREHFFSDGVCSR